MKKRHRRLSPRARTGRACRDLELMMDEIVLNPPATLSEEAKAFALALARWSMSPAHDPTEGGTCPECLGQPAPCGVCEGARHIRVQVVGETWDERTAGAREAGFQDTFAFADALMKIPPAPAIMLVGPATVAGPAH